MRGLSGRTRWVMAGDVGPRRPVRRVEGMRPGGGREGLVLADEAFQYP